MLIILQNCLFLCSIGFQKNLYNIDNLTKGKEKEKKY
jgi:hypothetical protein